MNEKLKSYLDSAKLGDKTSTTMAIEGHPTKAVQLVCTEVLNDGSKKTFSVFSHGVRITKVSATKEGGSWSPR